MPVHKLLLLVEQLKLTGGGQSGLETASVHVVQKSDGSLSDELSDVNCV